MNTRQSFWWVMLAAVVIGAFPVVAQQGEPADPKLKLAYAHLKFERMHPAELVAQIQTTLAGEERAVTKLIELAGDERADMRALTAMLLGELGEQEGADALWKLIRDESEFVRVTASGALIRLHALTPIAANAQGLKDERPAVRRLVAATLGTIRDKSAEGALVDVLHDDDELARMEITAALGMCGTKAAIPSLIEMTHDSSVLVRTAAVRALCLAEDPAVVPALLEALKDPDWHVRGSAVTSLSMAVGQDPAARAQVTDAWISRLEDDEFALVRDRAADALARADDEKAIAALIKAIVSDNRDARLHAARSLRTGKVTRALPLLQEHRQHTDPEVRLSIVEIFGAIGGEDQIPVIVEATEDSDSNVRLAAVSALRNLQKRAGAEPLRTKMGDPDPHVRAASARALGDLGDRDAVPKLIGLLRDPHGYVRGAAAESLGKLGDKTAVTPLISVLTDEKPSPLKPDEGGVVIGTGNEEMLPEMARLKMIEEKTQVIQALGELRDPTAVDPIIQHGLKAEDAGLRAESAVSLGRIGDVRAVDPLQEVVRPYYQAAVATEHVEDGLIAGKVPETVRQIRERESRVRASVAWALGQLGEKSSLEILTRAANDENSLVRDAANEALEKVAERQERVTAKQGRSEDAAAP